MSISLPKTSISILDAKIKLLSIPRANLREQMYAVTRCLAFREMLAAQRGSDPFFNLTLNSVECSVFADSQLVEKVFEGGCKEAFEASGIEISEDTWIALQVEQHDDQSFELSGGRVRDISAPLAAEGISILFLSTYISDFLLIKEHRLDLVLSILQRESFYSHNIEEPGSSLGTNPRSPFLQNYAELEEPATPSSAYHGSLPPSLSRSMTGSLLLSDKERSIEGRPRKQSGSPAASPGRVLHRDRSNSAVSHSSKLGARASSSSLSDRARHLLASPPRSDLGESSPATPSSPHMSPSDSLDGHMSSLELDQRPPSATVSQPRSYERMQDSILSESSAASGIFDKIALLPDELVCVGLHQKEKLWKDKILFALFYPEDILPREEHQALQQSDVHETGGEEHVHQEERGARQQKISLYSTTPTPNRPIPAGKERHTVQRSFSHSTQVSESAPILLTSTMEAEYPTPFLSLTLTTEGASLITDIRLLRALFQNEDESIVYATGQGGLSGLWGGEEEDFLDEEDDDKRGRQSLSHNRDKADEDSLHPFDDSGDWEKIAENGDSGDPEEQGEEDDSGRRLFKCLQLDLSSFGLEKAGLAHQFAGLLTGEKINLLYSSTFRTANILVAKRHIRKARAALESASR